jgi:hypothetical protein
VTAAGAEATKDWVAGLMNGAQMEIYGIRQASAPAAVLRRVSPDQSTAMLIA